MELVRAEVASAMAGVRLCTLCNLVKRGKLIKYKDEHGYVAYDKAVIEGIRDRRLDRQQERWDRDRRMISEMHEYNRLAQEGLDRHYKLDKINNEIIDYACSGSVD